MKVNNFYPLTLEDTTDFLASHFPDGRVWEAKNVDDTEMRNLIKCCARAFVLIQEEIYRLAIEADINLTVDLLPDWGNSVGLPNQCVLNLDSLEKRRHAVIQRLRKIAVTTKADFELMALELGYVVEVEPGVKHGGFQYDFPIYFGSTNPRFWMIVKYINSIFPVESFSYNFPIIFGESPFKIINCLFKQIVPANVIIYYHDGNSI